MSRGSASSSERPGLKGWEEHHPVARRCTLIDRNSKSIGLLPVFGHIQFHKWGTDHQMLRGLFRPLS